MGQDDAGAEGGGAVVDLDGGRLVDVMWGVFVHRLFRECGFWRIWPLVTMGSGYQGVETKYYLFCGKWTIGRGSSSEGLFWVMQ